MSRCLPILAIAFFFAGCESDTLFEVPDSGQPAIPDAGFAMDAAVPDVGLTDVGVPPADEPVYIHTGTTLYSYDPADNSATRVGDFRTGGGPLENVVDIAIDGNGRMFGGVTEHVGDGNFVNEVYVVDPETGFCRFLFEFDDILHGLTALDDGRLVVAGERVTVVDPDDGSALLSWPSTDAYRTSGDIVGLPDGNLYWTVRGEQDGDPDQVARIDPDRGSTTIIGQAPVRGIFGLGYADGELIGFTSNGDVVVLEPSSGQTIRETHLEGRWFGATTNPVVWP